MFQSVDLIITCFSVFPYGEQRTIDRQIVRSRGDFPLSDDSHRILSEVFIDVSRLIDEGRVVPERRPHAIERRLDVALEEDPLVPDRLHAGEEAGENLYDGVRDHATFGVTNFEVRVGELHGYGLNATVLIDAPQYVGQVDVHIAVQKMTVRETQGVPPFQRELGHRLSDFEADEVHVPVLAGHVEAEATLAASDVKVDRQRRIL